jgi:hypothetical protein
VDTARGGICAYSRMYANQVGGTSISVRVGEMRKRPPSPNRVAWGWGGLFSAPYPVRDAGAMARRRPSKQRQQQPLLFLFLQRLLLLAALCVVQYYTILPPCTTFALPSQPLASFHRVDVFFFSKSPGRLTTCPRGCIHHQQCSSRNKDHVRRT